jgi:hypothetical protein
VEEHRPVGGRDAVAERPAVVGVGDAPAAAVGLDQLGHYPGDTGKGLRERRGMVGLSASTSTSAWPAGSR